MAAEKSSDVGGVAELSRPASVANQTQCCGKINGRSGVCTLLWAYFPIKKQNCPDFFFDCNPPSLALCSLKRSTKFQFLMLAIQCWWGRGTKIINIFGKWLLNTLYHYYDFISFLRGSMENEVKDSFICHIILYYIILYYTIYQNSIFYLYCDFIFPRVLMLLILYLLITYVIWCYVDMKVIFKEFELQYKLVWFPILIIFNTNLYNVFYGWHSSIKM